MKSFQCPKCGRHVGVYVRAGAAFRLLVHHKAPDGSWCRWQQVQVKQRLEQSNQQQEKR